MDERGEGVLRLLVLLISGLVIKVWSILVALLAVINLIITLFSGRRDKSIANFCEIWNTQAYIFVRYVTFVSNERPFPFGSLAANISKFKR